MTTDTTSGDTETSYLRFTGRQRAAVEHLLANTPLGEALARVGTVRRSDALDIEVTAGQLASLSSGEWRLFEFLRSLAGYGTVNIWRLLASIDSDCQLAVVWTLGLATDHFAGMTPVRFGAL